MLDIEKKTLLKAHGLHRLKFALFMLLQNFFSADATSPAFIKAAPSWFHQGQDHKPQAPWHTVQAFFLPHEVCCSAGLPTVQYRLGNSPTQTFGPSLQGPSSVRSLLRAAEAQSQPRISPPQGPFPMLLGANNPRLFPHSLGW